MRFPTDRRRLGAKGSIVLGFLAVIAAGRAFGSEPVIVVPSAPSAQGAGAIVYRPAYSPIRGRPLYLSSYAGVYYPPLLRRDPLAPTMARVPARRPLLRLFGGASDR